MKKTLFTLLLLSQVLLHSQIQIKGKVVSSKKTPLEGATVYLNNTSIGSSTDTDGDFYFTVKKGVYTLVVSYIGFKTITYTLNTDTYTGALLFSMKAKTNILDEVVITTKKKKRKRKKGRLRGKNRTYFKKFNEAFIGKTKFSKDCQILNPNVLEFSFNKTTKALTVKASEPLKIKNKALGYTIDYDLEYFNLEKTKISYLGYSRFKEIETSNTKKEKKWKENRKLSYKGSKQHFLKSLIEKATKREGYALDLVKKIMNPKRASAGEITRANKYITEQKFKNVFVDFSKEIPYPSTKLDSAIVAVNSSKLPLHTYIIIEKNVKPENIIFYINRSHILKFSNQLRIRYLFEPEEKNYRPGKARKKYQESYLSLSFDAITLNSNGTFSDPLNVFVSGYWGYEQFGDELPLDYELPLD
ncbi:MAG: carboxypeptidase-like regulatory domain-containing protein [Flavobacteriaceae bacterium]